MNRCKSLLQTPLYLSLLLTASALAAPAAKVDLCHVPPGNPANVQSLKVSQQAVSAHLAHGDYTPVTFFADADGDGFGDVALPIEACWQPADTSTDGSDCDDSDPEVNPDADEVADGIDNDCDGDSDEGLADGTLCAAFRHSNAYSGFGFLSDNWGAAAPGLGAEGNQCAGMAITELRAEVYDDQWATAPSLATGWVQVGSNPFFTGNENAVYGNGSDTISVTVRDGFAPVSAGSIGGFHCIPLSNSYLQGSAICVSDGIHYQSVMGELNSGIYGVRIWMCQYDVWCGGPTSRELLIYAR